ncbi:MAG TPA: VTT domain-containing protein [Ktedonobacteraceae bacterium]|nr:VTT domain-containing protein [Ktedonobacteraceae bacterium]
MSVFLTDLLTFFQTYGYPALWVSVFIAAVGAPLPIGLVLLAAGAFAALGDFNVFLLALITVTASVAGDNVGYLVGKKWGSHALDWLDRSRFGSRMLPPRAIERSRAYFKHRGGWAVFLSRFLVSALGGIINLLAGSELFPYRAFLACDLAGETVGAIMSLALGFAFGASWEAVGDIVGSLSLFFVAMLVAALLCVRLLRYLSNSKQASQKIEIQSIPGLTPIIDPPAPSSGPLTLS